MTETGQAHIDNFGSPVLHHQYIRWLDVTVNDVPARRVVERFGDL